MLAGNGDMTLAHSFCTYLNHLLRQDRSALQKVVDHKVKATPALEDHPYLVVNAHDRTFGLVGILNGYLLLQNSKYIIAKCINKNGDTVEFAVQNKEDVKWN